MEHSLKFPDEATGRALLGSALNASRADENGDTVLHCYTHDYGLDLLGTIGLPPKLNAEGDVLTPGETLPGWHANLTMVRDPLPAALVPYEVFPKNPVCVWAR
jgi:hypothetical protein